MNITQAAAAAGGEWKWISERQEKFFFGERAREKKVSTAETKLHRVQKEIFFTTTLPPPSLKKIENCTRTEE